MTEDERFAEQLRAHVDSLTPTVEVDLTSVLARGRRRRTLHHVISITAVVGLIVAAGSGAAALGASGWDWGETPAHLRPAQETPAAPTVEPTVEPTTEPTTTAPTTAPTPTTTAIEVVRTEAWDAWWMGGQVFADAPLATFPVAAVADDALGCTDAQLAWLAEYGIASVQGVDLASLGAGDGVTDVREYTLTNATTPGTAVTVRNLRVEGEFTSQSPPRFAFACVTGGIGGYVKPYYEIATLGESSPATYLADPNAATFFDKDQLLAAGLDGAPFTADLAPGGTFQLKLILSSADKSLDFRGRLIGDVVIGDHTYQEVFDEGYLQTAPENLTSVFAIAGFGRLFCVTDESMFHQAYHDGVAGGDREFLAPYECTPQELADLVAAAQ